MPPSTSYEVTVAVQRRMNWVFLMLTLQQKQWQRLEQKVKDMLSYRDSPTIRSDAELWQQLLPLMPEQDFAELTPGQRVALKKHARLLLRKYNRLLYSPVKV